MLNLVEIIDRVNRLHDISADHEVEWIGPSSSEAIQCVENNLGVNIQGSYRDFLLLVGGGGLENFYISGVPKKSPLLGACSDTKEYRARNFNPMPRQLVVIERDADDNEPFCLDTSRVVNGENPVVLYYHQSTGAIEKVSNSFLEFYLSYLNPYFDEAGI